MLKLFYTIGQAATLLGVSVVTMRRWTASNKIHCTRTLGGHRRFKHDGLFPKENDGLTLLYARVSSRDQKEDLARLPHIGWVSMRESLRFQGKIVSATVSKVADRWFVSVAVEVSTLILKPAKNHGKVGVDLGVNTLATLWREDGTHKKEPGPRPMKRFLAQLRKLSKTVARRVLGSNGREKARLKLAALYARMANIRKDTTHKLTSMLSSNYSTVVIEDLNVRGMLEHGKTGMLKRQKRGLSRSIADMGFFEFRRQLEYKMEARGGQVIVADRYFPSSKKCSHCDLVFKELKQGQQKWTCMGCKTVHDRDVNAAHNLWRLA